MFVTPDVKVVGDHWDEGLGLYLDVEAQYQLPTFWWINDPLRYKVLVALRKAEGIEIEDHLPDLPKGASR